MSLGRAVVGGLLLVLVGLACTAQVPDGIGAGAFARWGIDARPSAMGGAFVAIAEGSPAAYYNPAGLARSEGFQVGGMYTTPYGADFGVSLQYANIVGVVPLQTPSRIVGPVGWGLTWVGLTIGEIALYDEDGVPTVTSAYGSLFLGSGGIGLPGAEDVWVGASVKVYSESLLEGRSFGMGLDLALLAEFSIGSVPLRVGVNSMDVGRTKIRWRGTSGEPDNYVPWVNKVGVSAELFHGVAVVEADFDWAMNRGPEEQVVRLGAEVCPVKGLAIRGGWHGDVAGGKSVFSAGVGLHVIDWLAIDYAYVPGSVFGAGHVLSARFEF